jgi:Glycosyltransferase family 87
VSVAAIPGRLQEGARALLASRVLWIWAAVWIVTRALMVAQIGFWNHESGINYQDAEFYKNWSDTLAHQHTIPAEDSWQYPPGAAFLLLVPRIGIGLFGASYQPSFVVLMLLVDLAGSVLMALLASRTGRSVGVWVWLLAIPLLQANPITRFDLVPTVLTMAALVVIHGRRGWFGALVGAGAAIKVWPILALFGEWDRRRLAVSAATAAATVILTFVVAGILFGDQSGFLGNQDNRGLQHEAVGAMPWYGSLMITGKPLPIVLGSGSAEIGGSLAGTEALVLKWLGLLVLVAAALWWVARDRAIRGGRTDLADASLSRDFVFTVMLLQIVVSRVLSPQYMIWVIGLAAVVLTAGTTRLARPAWIAVGAAVLTATIYASSANMLVRNAALLVAALDAVLGMIAVLRKGRGPKAARLNLTSRG